DGAPDGGRDRIGVADVQRQAGSVERCFEEPGAQHGGDVAGAGDEVDGQPGDRVPQRLPRLSRHRPGPAAGTVWRVRVACAVTVATAGTIRRAHVACTVTVAAAGAVWRARAGARV